MRRWLVAGAAGWAGVIALYLVVWGLRRMSAGLPFYSSWTQVTLNLVAMLTGALLTPLLVLAFRRIRAVPRPVGRTLALYIALGLSYWVVWAILLVAYQRILGPAMTTPLTLGVHLGRTLVFTALIALTLYTVMVLLFEAIWYRGQLRQKEVEAARLQAELARAQTAALRAQVNPRFLAAALSTASEVLGRDVLGARKVLSDLSELLRVSLGRNGTQLIELRDEIQLASRFVSIHAARLGDRVSVEFDIGDTARAQSVPPLVLQPLLAQAFELIAARPAGRGQIRVAGRPTRAALLLSVLVVSRGEGAADAPERADGARDDGVLAGIEDVRATLASHYVDHGETTVRPHGRDGLEMRLFLPYSRVP